MLRDIPYDTLKKDERAYKIMLLCDQGDNNLKDIAKDFKISIPRITQIYHRQKLYQLRLYINHISFVLGYSDTSRVKRVYDQACDCYWDRRYVCAYFENKYNVILTEYRNGEPGLPERFLKSLPPLTPEPSEETASKIIEMRENEKASFAEIAKKYSLTEPKARRIYDFYYHKKMMELLDTAQENAESEQEKAELLDFCIRNHYASKKRYERLLERLCEEKY